MKKLKLAVMTGGGDAPGLNAVIRAVVKHGAGQRGWTIVGIEDSFNGLLETPQRLVPLTPQSCQGLLHRGGTLLGTTNRGDPFAFVQPDGSVADRSAALADAFRAHGFDGLISIGGDGSQAIAARLQRNHGIPVIGVPKTIDNDLNATDFTFGFWSAIDVVTDALDRLHTTAEAHDRVMLLEVMGRTAGWIALYGGIAGGADCIAVPEVPYDIDRYVEKVRARQARGRHFTLFVVAEGARPVGTDPLGHKPKGAALRLADALAERIDVESRVTVLGHLQRGGSPVPFDRVLATRFGVHAVELAAAGRWGRMVRLRHGRIDSVPLEDAAVAPRLVDLDNPLLATARAVGIELGAPAED